MNRIRVLNGQFDPLTLQQTVDAVFDTIQGGARGWVCTVNVAYLMMQRADARLRRFVEKAKLVVADGEPLIWCAPWFDRSLPERVTGIDMIEPICERAAREGKRVYFLGATQQIVGQVARAMKERFPDLQLDYADGFFTRAEAPARADVIRASGADILFVGMGVPRQEIFLEEQWERLGVSVAIGVGGSFDVLAGLRSRAPRWMQRSGLEWLFRLLQEPRRLFMRYLVTNTKFILLLMRALMRSGRSVGDAWLVPLAAGACELCILEFIVRMPPV